MDKLIKLRSSKDIANGDFKFHIFDVHVEDSLINNTQDDYGTTYNEYFTDQVNDDLFDDENIKRKSTKIFTLKLFGVTSEGKSVCLHINDFEPYFYILIPSIWEKYEGSVLERKVARFKDRLISQIDKINSTKDYYRSPNIEIDIVKKQSLYWFDNKKKLGFMKIRFRNISDYYNTRNVFIDRELMPIKVEVEPGVYHKMKMYEGNIEPMLKFFHEQDIKPCGWCVINQRNYENIYDEHRITTCNYELVCSYKNVMPYECNDIAPFITASFDIECDSLHGDFPLAVKKYNKTAKDILEGYYCIKDVSNYHNDIYKRFLAMFGYKKNYGDIGLVSLKRGEKIPKKDKLQSIAAECMDMCKHNQTKKELIERIANKLNREFPLQNGDKVVQIGTTFRVGKNIIGGHIINLGGCNDVPNTIVETTNNELDLIIRWMNMIRKVDPDIITGYNINGFDYDYIFHRLIELNNIKNEGDIIFPGISRVNERGLDLKRLGSKYKYEVVSSAAMGDNINKYITTFGRINMDLMKVIRKTYMSLESYKLDSVAASFMNGPVITKEKYIIENGKQLLRCNVKTCSDLKDREYVSFTDGETWISPKYNIIELNYEDNYFVIEYPDDEEERIKVWKKAKDDVPPQEIFRLHKENDAGRAKVAKYCIQDCNLVLEIDQKVENIAKAIAMANVCSVPLGYIFARGQGIKLASLTFKECSKRNILIETLGRPQEVEGEVDGYEGAVVLEPKTGIYLDEPVSVLDYSSLYPSSIISENISHDSIVWIKDYDLEGNYIEGSMQGNEIYDNLPGYNYILIEYDRQGYHPDDTRKNKKKIKVGTRVCRFAQPKDQSKSTIPNILIYLLGERKKRKKLMKLEKDPFKYNLLDAEQLAYKMTANSLYGQMGAKTSKFSFIALAACTTSFGRKLLNYAKEGLERIYGNGNSKVSDATYIYGDTDSVFVNFRPKGPNGEILKGEAALKASIELSVKAEKVLSAALKSPHCLEYEKTFMPFILLSKKRYIGNKYEFDPNKFKRTNMGVVTKRRDNAPIVKVAYNTMNNILMSEKSVPKTVIAIQEILNDLINGKYGLEYLTITKSLKAHYADPTKIAHKVLADRIGERDPGNKPKPNDRLGFVYIHKEERSNIKLLQGDKIETPEFIKENNIQPDYKFYITNQIMKPILQVLAIVVDKIPGYNKPKNYFKQLECNLRMSGKSQELIDKNIQTEKEKIVQELVFQKYINRAQQKVGPINRFFTKKKHN